MKTGGLGVLLVWSVYSVLSGPYGWGPAYREKAGAHIQAPQQHQVLGVKKEKIQKKERHEARRLVCKGKIIFIGFRGECF